MEQPVHWPQRIHKEPLVHLVPLEQVFLPRGVDRRLGNREVDAGGRRVAVGALVMLSWVVEISVAEDVASPAEAWTLVVAEEDRHL